MDTTDRVDRAERAIAAAPDAVYAALVDADALAGWLPPGAMSGRMERFDGRVGGGFRMVLSHPPEALATAGEDGPGKTTDLDDVVDVTFTALEPAALVEWEAVFDAPDPAFAGVMTQTWTLTSVDVPHEPRGASTQVVIEARGVPEGISVADHEVGLNASLEQLAAWVTGH